MDNTASGVRDVIIVGGGLAGLSAAIYLGRSKRDTLIFHTNRSMAIWEPDVQNYLGFPDGIDGNVLLARGMTQARRFGVEMIEQNVDFLMPEGDHFCLNAESASYRSRRVLLATGLTHLPPEIPGVKECLGRSLFFCKDCDAYRVQDKQLVILGSNNEAADYALGMLMFSASVTICTNGRTVRWDHRHAAWLDEYAVPMRHDPIRSIVHDDGHLTALTFEQGDSLEVDAAFTTRGDVVHNALAARAGAKLDEDGQIIVDQNLSTTVPGLYAAGCVTPANCQMIVAAGQGALAAQAINRDLFADSLERHALPRVECRLV